MHIFRVINAFICIKNHVNSSINSMLSHGSTDLPVIHHLSSIHGISHSLPHRPCYSHLATSPWTEFTISKQKLLTLQHSLTSLLANPSAAPPARVAFTYTRHSKVSCPCPPWGTLSTHLNGPPLRHAIARISPDHARAGPFLIQATSTRGPTQAHSRFRLCLYLAWVAPLHTAPGHAFLCTPMSPPTRPRPAPVAPHKSCLPAPRSTARSLSSTLICMS